jgi:hypothetical protein
MELPVYRMTVDEVDEGVQFVALVDMPAIEKPFQAFAKTPQRFAETGERRVLTGPLMLADTPIYRKDDTYGEYYVVFDKATIRKIVQKYFKQGNQHNVNAYHNAELDGVFMFESYITDAERGHPSPEGIRGHPRRPLGLGRSRSRTTRCGRTVTPSKVSRWRACSAWRTRGLNWRSHLRASQTIWPTFCNISTQPTKSL